MMSSTTPWFRSLLVGMMLICGPVRASVELRMEGGRVWLTAEKASLDEVLQMFQARGVEVFVDPSIDPISVSGEWENVEANRLISQVVSPHSYLISWQREKGPLGPLYRMSTLRIFAEGRSADARPLSDGQRVLDVVEDEEGRLHIRSEIMVGFGPGAKIEDLKALLEAINGTVISILDPPGVYRIRVGEGVSVAEAKAIAQKLASVKSAEPNWAFRRDGVSSSSGTGLASSMNLQLQPGEKIIAVFDSGLDPQYADLSVIRGTYDALNRSTDIFDPTGHGTLTALLAGGVITPEGAEASSAGAAVLAIRTFDENGMTSMDTVMHAVHYALDAGVSIISMSWGSNVDSRSMEAAMAYAAERGVTLYASAGNESTGEVIYPAGYPSVIGVGGLNADGTRWENSNYGAFVEQYEWAKAYFNGKLYEGTSVSGPYAAFKEAQN